MNEIYDLWEIVVWKRFEAERERGREPVAYGVKIAMDKRTYIFASCAS